MPWDGFYEGLTCNNCGKELSGFDGDRPAESYAGTYTGLCYDCQKLSKVLHHTYPLDGCKLYSYPPLNPSWRRDRTAHRAYDNCPECGGDGRIIKYNRRTMSRYYSICDTCSNRYFNHPRRREFLDKTDRLRRVFYTCAEEEWKRQVLNLELTKNDNIEYIYRGKKKVGFKYVDDKAPNPPILEELRKRLLKRHERDLELNQEILRQEFPDVIEDQSVEKHPLLPTWIG